jgi:endo-1,3-1,4-beta-glycanase ExoK
VRSLFQASSRASRAAVLALLIAGCGSRVDLVIGRQSRGAGSAGQAGEIAVAGAGGGGEAGSGGSAGSGGAAANGGQSGNAGSGPFELVVRDDFDALDENVWERATHSFEENLADFSADNAVVRDGTLILSVTQKAAGSPGKTFAAAEVRTRQSFTYGKFVARARFAPTSGVVTTMFTFHDLFGLDETATWNEIVLEGRTGLQPRLHFVSSYPNPVDAMQKVVAESFVSPEFNPADDFHELAFEWTPAHVHFSIDGVLVNSLSPEPVAALTRDQRFVVSVYPSSEAWAGAFSAAELPTTAEYDWVEVYSYAE